MSPLAGKEIQWREGAYVMPEMSETIDRADVARFMLDAAEVGEGCHARKVVAIGVVE